MQFSHNLYTYHQLHMYTHIFLLILGTIHNSALAIISQEHNLKIIISTYRAERYILIWQNFEVPVKVISLLSEYLQAFKT